MFPHTAWTEGAQRAAHLQHEAETQRALVAAGLGFPTRHAVARVLRSAAEALARTADRLAPSHTVKPQRSIRPPAASA